MWRDVTSETLFVSVVRPCVQDARSETFGRRPERRGLPARGVISSPDVPRPATGRLGAEAPETPGLRRTLMVLGRAGAPTGPAGGRALGWWRSVCRHLRVPANGRDRWLGQEGSIQIVVVPEAGCQSIEHGGASAPVGLRFQPAAARFLDARGRGADSPLRQRRLESLEDARGPPATSRSAFARSPSPRVASARP